MRGRGHIFDDPRKLNEMLELRKAGVSTISLGARYGVDHSTIVYHSKRYGVSAQRGVRTEVVSVQIVDVGEVTVRRPTVVVVNNTPRVNLDFDGTVINTGKSYAEYMAEAKRREQLRKFGRPLLPDPKPSESQ